MDTIVIVLLVGAALAVPVWGLGLPYLCCWAGDLLGRCSQRKRGWGGSDAARRAVCGR